ncbi:MAG: hypothetical protein ACKPKO_28040, partial [Candidatus Fonsibacter sp.]
MFLWFSACFFIYKCLDVEEKATHQKTTLIHDIVLNILLVVVISNSIYLLIQLYSLTQLFTSDITRPVSWYTIDS